MKTYFDCIPCFVKQALTAGRFIGDDISLHEEIIRQTLKLLGEIDLRQSPPAMARLIYRRITEITGVADPYKGVKSYFNEYVLKLYPLIKATIETSPDRLETAVKLAIAGNIIDFGVNGSVDKQQVRKSIGHSLDIELDKNDMAEFRIALDKADNILYLGDNAGEIVFDKALIEVIGPSKIIFAVKGKAVLNDAIMEDAEQVGMTELVKVIDNGADAPGTILDICSESFREYFDRADLVISKGQGNYETLSEVDKNIYFMLKIKCPIIAEHIGQELLSVVLKKHNFVKGD